MTAEERAALIDRLAPLIIEERRKAAEQNPKCPPWYMVNIAHPVMGWLYNQYLAKLGKSAHPVMPAAHGLNWPYCTRLC